MAKFHDITGLPRSGSTLLSAILRQNPRFHARVTSPLQEMCARIIDSVSSTSEYHALVSDQVRHDLLKGLFTSFYRSEIEQLGEDAVIFDTSRGWPGDSTF